jgi:hypothetical protein
VECIDRMYLNGYVGTLATGGQLKWFLKKQMKKPYASPAVEDVRFSVEIRDGSPDHYLPFRRPERSSWAA